MTDFFTAKVTIYNDISIDKVRRFGRFVIDKCQITGQLVENNNSTIRKVVNVDTVITKDIKHYKSPVEYAKLAETERSKYYTVQTGDFVVLGEVDDTVSDANEFVQLQSRYKDSGIKITSVSANINGMAVDNIMMM